MEHDLDHRHSSATTGADAAYVGDDDNTAVVRHALAVAAAVAAQNGSAVHAHLADTAMTSAAPSADLTTTTTTSSSGSSNSSSSSAPQLAPPQPQPQPLSAAAAVSMAIESLEPNVIDGKKTGRPVHPLWAFFHRGDKRNRYHYHAFCIYCVARYGAEHVAPTRGVSVDMLRHIEKCTNCPRRVVESVKDICGRHDAVRVDRYLKKKADAGEELTSSSSSSSSAAAAAAAANARRQLHSSNASSASTTGGEAARLQQHAAQPSGHSTLQQTSAALKSSGRTLDASVGRVMMSNSTVRASGRSSAGGNSAPIHRISSAHTARLVLGKHALRASASGISATAAAAPATGERHPQSSCAAATQTQMHSGESDASPSASKRARTGASAAHRATAEWSRHALKAAVAAGLPLQAFQNADMQQLLQYVAPSATNVTGVASATARTLAANVSDAAFVAQTADALARAQLDRVKEGMHNSMIKGGLTLSITCWATLDLQQLVAFTLVNSNGDAACVCVADMGTQPNAYSSAQLAVKIEDVLQQLEAQRICVMGIVADSVVALNAARCACLAAPARRSSLLVVPCFARQLSVLAGSLLTHARFRDAVGRMVEVAAYLSHASLQSVLQVVSGDGARARIPLPNRSHWYSFVECITALLKYCDVVTALCSADSTGASTHSDGVDADDDVSSVLSAAVVPRRLKELVFADESKLWKTLQELHTLLLPLKETYALVFQGRGARAAGVDTDTDADIPGELHGGESDTFAALPAHGLTLAHIMYQLARMHQQYGGLVGTQHGALAAMMQTQLNTTWQRYDLPAMALAYAFNFHLDTSLLLRSPSAALEWPAIAAYFHAYYSTWFGSKHNDSSNGDNSANSVRSDSAPVAAASGNSGSSDPDAAPSAPTESAASAASELVSSSSNSSSSAHLALAPIAADKVHELLSAYKTQQFPFDADTTSDYVDVSSFYSFVSDSHPEICALCCRLYALALLSANVQRVVRGIGFVPTATQTTKSPESVELLLHIGFAASMQRCVQRGSSEASSSSSPVGNGGVTTSTTSTSTTGGDKNEHTSVVIGLHAVMGGRHADEIFWNGDEWDEFAGDWRSFLELELAMGEFDAITALARESSMHTHSDGDDSAAVQHIAELLNRKAPLDNVFAGTLPPLAVPGVAMTASAPAAPSTTSPGPDNDDDVEDASVLL